eukprot:8454565-Karenia_brevis.AAC.1
MRALETMEWSDEKHRHWDHAVRGSSALRAALGQMVMQECSKEKELLRVMVLWDIEKLYDSMLLPLLLDAAIGNGYPIAPLLLAIRCYLGPRLV